MSRQRTSDKAWAQLSGLPLAIWREAFTRLAPISIYSFTQPHTYLHPFTSGGGGPPQPWYTTPSAGRKPHLGVTLLFPHYFTAESREGKLRALAIKPKM